MQRLLNILSVAIIMNSTYKSCCLRYSVLSCCLRYSVLVIYIAHVNVHSQAWGSEKSLDHQFQRFLVRWTRERERERELTEKQVT